MHINRNRISSFAGWLGAAVVLSALAILPGVAGAQAAKAAPKDQPYTVEYYYKTQWGTADEWLRLFKKNHLPLLKALKENGRIVEIEIEKPRYHMTEDGRWDYRVTIEWKNMAASVDSADEQALTKKLFPDQETFQREERRRFEILIAHWDLPTVDVRQE